ncbi:GtrA-like protein [Snodgrassella communis]|uniref:GtrA family protein n=1 Tax=Snodgrassella communis TaxID=2946699 RepID=UPI0004618065|nr:GtrA family protein [Snodgrassella communis]KDN12841.1 GtrA-like protein [Snodgrassella communis]
MKIISRQGILFGLVGTIAAAMHFCCLLLLVQHAQLKPVLANPLAFLCAFVISFIGHYHLTFSQTRHSWLQALWRWLCSALAGFGLNQILFMVGIKLFGNQAYWWLWFIVTIIVTFLSFVLGKFWAFNEKVNHEACND